jgi:uncharacterized Fe-S radical SAM superfamily protein PflX
MIVNKTNWKNIMEIVYDHNGLMERSLVSCKSILFYFCHFEIIFNQFWFVSTFAIGADI